MIYPHLWKSVDDPRLGLMTIFNDIMRTLGTRSPNYLPDVRSGQTIFIASDYSGQHDLARYETFSFLFADLQRCNRWEERRRRVRQDFLADGRRMAFKNLSDRQRRKALAPFLVAADAIPGLSVTILIDKGIDSLFQKHGKIRMSEPELRLYQHWHGHTFERLLRAVHLVSFFLAGLSRQDQDVLWITDEDDIAANPDRLGELTQILADVSSHYLGHNMRHLRCGTTSSDDGSRSIEDLTSIPDLVAGALTEVLSGYRNEGITISGLIVSPPESLSEKTVKIMDWFSTDSQPLKRLVFAIERVGGLTALTLKQFQFHGLPDIDSY
jgi:hypothetical protein